MELRYYRNIYQEANSDIRPHESSCHLVYSRYEKQINVLLARNEKNELGTAKENQFHLCSQRNLSRK